MLPPVDKSKIEEALSTFDRTQRSLPEWSNWQDRSSYRYGILEHGRLYPPKEIVSIATGVPVDSFSGGGETNGYLKKRGFQIEALRLPVESEVQSVLHDMLLDRSPNPVEPTDAYAVLAERFALSSRLLALSLQNGSENHWQNRVRQARRKLVNEGVVDSSERGTWRLLRRSRPVVWVEKTLVKGRPDRVSGADAVGRALWSPLRSKNEADIYRNMRRVQPGDFVLHLTDNEAFTGVSVADGFARTDFVGVEGTDWAGLPSYRVPLRLFQALDPPLLRSQLLAAPDLRSQLEDIRRAHDNLFYDPDMDLHQGGYLTEVPEALLGLLDSAYENISGRHLSSGISGILSNPILSTEQVTYDATDEQGDDVASKERQVWLYAPGQNASYWKEFLEAGIAAIGWDEIGDLGELLDVASIRQRMAEVGLDSDSAINANQCFDFCRRMRPGDWIFAKRGRKEIVGFGVVRSEYRFNPARRRFRNVREVDWRKSGVWPTATHRLLSMKTLTEITEDDVQVSELESLVGLTEPPLAPAVALPPYSIEDLCSDTEFPREIAELWLRRLTRKKHLILQGPPGTGKTYVAERLARLLTSGTFGAVETVQFHPSYGYEDFMHGIRPVVADGTMTFERAPGRFLQFCKHARNTRDSAPCVLIIDEINRANLSRVFGELMYLLEYRDKMIPLAGEEAPFGIPPNVYIIGTMNTADRSIAVVDHALRRRFSFVHLGPDYEALGRHLKKVDLPSESLVRALRMVNSAIDDRNYEIGISFFLRDGVNLRATLADIWEGEIEPYLEEYFYDQPARLEPLRWKSISSQELHDWSEIEVQ